MAVCVVGKAILSYATDRKYGDKTIGIIKGKTFKQLLGRVWLPLYLNAPYSIYMLTVSNRI